MLKYILTIAGSDSSGGAGIQADIRTITALGAHALTAVAAVTAQNSVGVSAVHAVPAAFVEKQIESVVQDVVPHAVKLGMLYTPANIRKVAALIRRYRLPNVVLDPVLKATTGNPLIASDAVSLLKKELIPVVTVVTPNLEEASLLSDRKVEDVAEMEGAARAIHEMGPSVVVTGGHLRSACVDVLFDGEEMVHFRSERIPSRHTHGSGCVFSTALAAFLAITGDLRSGAAKAHAFTHAAIERGYACGRGAGPVDPGVADERSTDPG